MKEYELCIETMNPCGGKEYAQREFRDVETDDPVAYVRQMLQDREVKLDGQTDGNGVVTVYADCSGMIQKFIFTPV